MEITQIRYFLEVAQSEHMTRSAERLHIAQPALSQAIRRMEKELGVPLFVSKGRNIVLTEYGKYLQGQLKPIMEKLDSLPHTLQKMAKINYDTIHISVLAASAMLTQAIIEYEGENKEINFRLTQNSDEETYDIQITTKAFNYTANKNDKNQFVCPERIFLAVPNNEQYRDIKSIKLADVENEGFISLLGSKQFRYICDRLCQQAGINPHIIFESDNPAAVKNMIAANLGIGFWPEFTWGKIDSDKIKLIEIDEPNCSRNIIITYNENYSENKNISEFFEFLKDYFERHKIMHI
jgi:DNA-binding transcriptional LysR family regulator